MKYDERSNQLTDRVLSLIAVSDAGVFTAPPVPAREVAVVSYNDALFVQRKCDVCCIIRAAESDFRRECNVDTATAKSFRDRRRHVFVKMESDRCGHPSRLAFAAALTGG